MMFPPKQSRLPTVLWPSPYVGRVQVLLVQVIIQWVGDSAVRCWFEVLLSRTKVKKKVLCKLTETSSTCMGMREFPDDNHQHKNKDLCFGNPPSKFVVDGQSLRNPKPFFTFF